jgi:hypothetical protein
MHKLYSGLRQVPHELKAWLPHLEDLPMNKLSNTVGIILTGKRTVRKAIMRAVHRETTQERVARIRQRIDDGAARWRKRHGAVQLTPSNYQVGTHLDALYIRDPANKGALSFNPDAFAKLMGASEAAGGRKI